MATSANTYQCPNCTGPLNFDSGIGKLKCEYCDSTYTVSEVEELYAQKEREAIEAHNEEEALNFNLNGEWNTSELNEDWGADGEGMKSYSCPSCGAGIICDATTAATKCPYCGNPTVIPGQFKGTLRPDLIIPFKLDQEKAEKALLDHYNGKFLLPSEFKSKNTISEIKGIYVPFWFFDGSAKVDAEFRATRVSVVTTSDEEVTTTMHYKIERAGTIKFEKIPVDGSSKMPNEYMDSIEPFNYDEFKPFSTAYLPGYLADKYDETVEECKKRADERAKNTALSVIKASIKGYDTCIMSRSNISLDRGKVHYGLLPVYMLHTKWNGEDFLFAINGQTGKTVGKLPVSTGKFIGLFIGLGVVLSIIACIALSILL